MAFLRLMSKLPRLAALALVSLLSLSAVLAVPATSTPGIGLDALDGFIGTWVLADENGEPTDQVISVVRKTAGGSALIETLFPGSDTEMITMYYTDGDQLKLTHYCSCAAHPVMVASRDEEGNLRFDCVGRGENFADCKTTTHMHDAVYRFEGEDRVHTTWRMMEDGALGHIGDFQFVRQPAPAEDAPEKAVH